MTTTDAPALETAAGEPPSFDLIVHQGFDTFAGSRREPAVKGGAILMEGSESCSYTLCETSETLRETLMISVDAAAGFGVTEVDAKTKYVKELRLTSTSIVAALYSNVVKGTYSSMNAEPDVAAPGPDQLDAFYQVYGDSYISELTFGGEYIATYTFYCESTTDQESTTAALAAEGVVEGGDMTVQVQHAIETVQKSQIVRSEFKQLLIGCADLKLPDEQTMVEFALSLPTINLTAPKLISIKTTGYEHIKGMERDTWLPIIDNRNKFQDESQQGVNAVGSALEQLSARMQWIIGVYGTYGHSGDPDVANKYQTVVTDSEVLKNLLQHLREYPTQPFNVPTLPSLTLGQPILNFEGPSLSDFWGGNDTEYFCTFTIKDILDQVVLEEVQLLTGAKVDRLSLKYSDNPDLESLRGTGGHLSPFLVLNQGQFVTGIKGCDIPKHICYLAIIANDQQIGGGGSAGEPFNDWAAPEGSIIVGFEGYCGTRVDGVGPLICTFKAAKWA